MKKFYLLVGSALLFGSSFAQVSKKTVNTNEVFVRPAVANKSMAVSKDYKKGSVNLAKGDAENVYFSEDWSNGLDGQEGQAWVTGGAQGDLWFYTFPLGAPNGYNPTVINSPAYSAIPNYYGATNPTIDSETNANGFMMLDADAFNSTSTSPNDPAGPNTTDIPIESFLISPAFDMTGAEGGVISFAQDFRLCCLFANMNLFVDVSVNNGNTWFEGYAFTYNNSDDVDAFAGTSVADISAILNSTNDLTQVRLRFRWPFGELTTTANGEFTNSHYYWMIDDIVVSEPPANDLIVGKTFWNDYILLADRYINDTINPISDSLYVSSFEYWRSPNYSTRPLTFSAAVTNNGTEIQTGVVLTARLNNPDGTTFQEFTSEPISIESGVTDTLSTGEVFPDVFNMATPPFTGNYLVNYVVTQNEEDFNESDNVGGNRGFSLNDDSGVEPENYATFQNTTTNFAGVYNLDNGSVVNRFHFNTDEADEILITAIEFVVLKSDGNEWTTPIGTQLNVNLRRGAVLDESDTYETQMFFGDTASPYSNTDWVNPDNDETNFIVEESNRWDQDENPNTLVWARWVLPSPVLVEAGEIYQPEVRFPNTTPGTFAAWLAYEFSQESFSGLFFNNLVEENPNNQWTVLGNFDPPYDDGGAPMIRLRTQKPSTLGIDQISIANGVELLQNYPNPFVDVTRMSFRLKDAREVSLEIHDINGRLVQKELLGQRPAGVTDYIFNAKNLEAGVYTYTVVTEDGRLTRKMIVE